MTSVIKQFPSQYFQVKMAQEIYSCLFLMHELQNKTEEYY